MVLETPGGARTAGTEARLTGDERDPFLRIVTIAGGYALPRCLHVVAELGVADALEETPQTAVALAAAVGAHPDALGRVLRLLAAHGVFGQTEHRFAHSPASRLLRSDHPRSMRAFARMFGLPVNWITYGALVQSVRTGLPATAVGLPGGFWTYFAEHPDEAEVFDAAMTAKAHGQVAGVLAAYDFTRFGLIGDIGGGRGHLLRAALDVASGATGVLFDLPHVIEAAANMASERLRLQAGDFFTDALPSCDAYLLMTVIHDWGDEEAAAILRAVRRAAPPGSKLLLIEQMLPADPGPHWSKTLDIHMLALLGGRERTREEYVALLAHAGFAFEREIETGADVSILEAVPA